MAGVSAAPPMPPDAARFSVLWSLKPSWAMRELHPYLLDIVAPGSSFLRSPTAACSQRGALWLDTEALLPGLGFGLRVRLEGPRCQ